MLSRLVFILFFLPLSALAEGLPRPQSDTVSDFADVLSVTEEAEISALIRDIRADTGVHVVVVTMDRISQHGGLGLRFETYAAKLFNAWGIGDAKRDDGIMILVAVSDRETRIELGSGYSAAYDARAAEVIETAILPKFRERQMARGIISGVKAVRDRVAEPFVKGSWIGLADLWKTALIGLGIVGGGVGLIFAGKAAWTAYYRCPQCGQPSLSRWSEVIDHATTYSSGSGITHLSCSLCGYAEDRPYTISRVRDDDDHGSSSSSGSSSSGFGGGSSSGGGASGKW
jgi:uncharacterized protein